MSYTAHGNINGVDVGVGIDIEPIWLTRENKEWDRPVVLLNRKSIRQLNELSKEKIIETLFETIRDAENKTMLERKEYYNQEPNGGIPV